MTFYEEFARKYLETLVGDSVADVRILSVSEFRLKPGSPLLGLVLGYDVLYGGSVLEPLILNFLKELLRDKYVLHNEYGTWNLSHYARITYNLRVRRFKGLGINAVLDYLNRFYFVTPSLT